MTGAARLRSLFNWRLLLGLGVTGAALYWTLRDVDYGQAAAHVVRAQPLVLVLMLPLHPLVLYLRALRWRQLSASLPGGPLPVGALFRATAVGFLAINLLPFRVGELVRPWFLMRETGVRASAALGTLMLERAVDFATLLAIGAVVLYAHPAELPGWIRTGAVALAGVAAVPLAIVVAMRVNRDATLAVATALVRPLPDPLDARVRDVVTQLCDGLGALRGAPALGLVVLHSLLIWAVVIPLQFALGLAAFDIELPLAEAVPAVYTVLVFTALAVAAPSAPGFFGVYHFACREALTLFGVGVAAAVAYATVVHLTFWVPVTAVGALVAARSGTRLADLQRRSGG